MRARPNWAFLDWPHPIPFAHRGGAAEHPENTMAAFAAAVELGYRYLETDVHATADGQLIAFHDDDLDRATDQPGAVSRLSFDQLRRVRVRGEPIPGLEEVLVTWPDTRFYIDAKDDASVALLVAALDRTNAYERVHRLLPNAACRPAAQSHRRTGLHLDGVDWDRSSASGQPEGAHAAVQRLLHAQVPIQKGPFTLVDRRFVDAARRRDVAVHVYPVNDRPEMERLLDLGVDGILSDRPSLLKEVFCERGLWV